MQFPSEDRLNGFQMFGRFGCLKTESKQILVFCDTLIFKKPKSTLCLFWSLVSLCFNDVTVTLIGRLSVLKSLIASHFEFTTSRWRHFIMIKMKSTVVFGTKCSWGLPSSYETVVHSKYVSNQSWLSFWGPSCACLLDEVSGYVYGVQEWPHNWLLVTKWVDMCTACRSGRVTSYLWRSEWICVRHAGVAA